MDHSRKKKQTGGLRIWNLEEHRRNEKWDFQRLIKNDMDQEKNVEFPGVLVFGLAKFGFCQIFGSKALFCPELNTKCSIFEITYQVVIKSANHYFFLN